MKKILTCILLLVFMAPFATRANDVVDGNEKTNEINFVTRDHDPVAQVMAKEIDDDNVEVSWSFNDMSFIEDFETGSFGMSGWNNEISSHPWQITTTNPYEGTYCMKSTNENVDSSTSAIEITTNIPIDGVISFYSRVSSERNYDFGYFFIDGVQMSVFTGESNWVRKEFEVTEGIHTFRWEYTKDHSDFLGEDCMYVDYINFMDEPMPVDPGWLYYDNGEKITALGMYDGSGFYWGIQFPDSIMASYEGYSLRKVSMFDNREHTGNIMIYQGGTSSPGTLVYTQPYSNTGSKEFVEFELSDEVTIDPTQSMWIVMNGIGNSIAALSTEPGTPNGRWCSVDGVEWFDIVENGWEARTWMLRGYVSNSKGEVAILKDKREVQSFNVYRADCDSETGTLIGTTSDTIYTDNTWGGLEKGEYKYGVGVVYEDGGESPIVWSDCLEKDLMSTLEETVTTEALYPNPTNGDLMIEVEGMRRITVVSVMGQVMMDKVVEGNQEVVDMSQMKDGVYMVRIASESGVIVKRITVIK